MKRVGIIVAVIAGLTLVVCGGLYWAYGDFAKGVIDDAKNYPMDHSHDTIVVKSDTLVRADVK